MNVTILDSTLRDGAQGENISFTNRDKFAIVKRLDKLGISFIEAGNPASNPKDMDFFKEAKLLNLQRSKLVAFGATRRKDTLVNEDKNVIALIEAQTEVVSIFGKSSASQVSEILNTNKAENLAMISDTIAFLKSNGKTVIFDAEHFFDGYNNDSEYAIETIEAAAAAGADIITLCDTNGATFCEDIMHITNTVTLLDCIKNKIPIGIHCHNDIGCAVASTLMAVNAGASHIQGTYIGFGERCGNANLAAIIPTLQLKQGIMCIPQNCMERVCKTARFIADIANVTLDNSMPYVGKSAFSHKGGMHVDGITKNTASFEHIDPEIVGNKRNILMSEMAGRSAMLNTLHDIDPTITKDSAQALELVDKLKELEFNGYSFESATASLELIIIKYLDKFKPFFELLHFRVIGEQIKGASGLSASAMIKIRVGNETEITAAEGEGPVNALDLALKKAVQRFFPEVSTIRLVDYKVRVMEPSDATAALVRVMIVSSDQTDVWTTVGVSRDIIDASLQALVDSVEYKLSKVASRKANGKLEI